MKCNVGKYQQAVEEFLGKYEKPVVEPITVGFSGIDPQRKYFGSAGTENHELLSNLQGGDDDGHFHLTEDQLDWVIEQVNEAYKPVIDGGQEIVVLPDEEIDPYQIIVN